MRGYCVHGYIPLRFGGGVGNIVRRMGTQQQLMRGLEIMNMFYFISFILIFMKKKVSKNMLQSTVNISKLKFI